VFVDRAAVSERLAGKRIALVGSGPGVLGNEPGFVDSHDVVIRVNNHKLIDETTGHRTDVHYSFYGQSIKKSRAELKREGVTLCMCKCPNAKAMESRWHERMHKPHGVDFRYIFEARAEWWFCATYVPTVEEFLAHVRLLGGHVPTTGFAALLDVLTYSPASVYMTGFDFFTSGRHNVSDRWNPGRPDDPIGHLPQVEAAWLRWNMDKHPISVDKALANVLEGRPWR